MYIILLKTWRFNWCEML